ncbi:N-acetylglucosaminyl-diphospho-decaprenol L-rhamnosyltransferase [bioreactor metagenome]|uniref:N-acetylglucosaminyl-diphospho-decaprenol L-rhamnosyltransferase n=1 Tax=bioreactor metagenome TaxID=1076179 RepID=A0A645D1X0_9ZZZZ
MTSLSIVKSPFTLYVIDNSPTNVLKVHFTSIKNIRYIHNPKNPGFGVSHNIALKFSIKDMIPYHFVINPDVYFKEDVITSMVRYIQEHDDIGMMMPQILNNDGTIQYLPKLLPSPYSLIMRKLKHPNSIYTSFINEYELRKIPSDMIYEAPVLSGCFTLFNVKALKEIGIYDDRFFMYFEDWDISRRMNQKYKTIYFPSVSVYHAYEAGANKEIKLLKIFLNSARNYFNKWGWFFDRERKKINKKTLMQFQ